MSYNINNQEVHVFHTSQQFMDGQRNIGIKKGHGHHGSNKARNAEDAECCSKHNEPGHLLKMICSIVSTVVS